MIDARLTIDSGHGRREVLLSSYLAPEAEESAHAREYAWIKGLRNLPVEGQTFRQRFTARGDSLWWFTELYLHKGRVVLDIFRTIAAVNALIERERPLEIRIESAPLVVRHVLPTLAATRGVRTPPAPGRMSWWRRLAALDLRARRLTLSAHFAPERARRVPEAGVHRGAAAAFVHRAFWKRGGEDGSAESYIGPVLAELERQLGTGGVQYVGVGAHTNYRERKRRAAASLSENVLPVERLAPLTQLAASRAEWRARYASFRVLTRSRALAAAAVIDGVDCWPLVREQLAGVAWLQWPWSVRAMDEAAAALDVLEPTVVVTYAEAGGWGRALILEARRRGIPTAGLQHGFIYRHWLNYRHEPDEQGEDEHTAFPRPTKTLLFDDYAAAHLRDRGRFPPESLQVTGSPRLDALVETIRSLPPDAVENARREAGLGPSDVFVLVTTKEREARGALPPLVEAAKELPAVKLVIKPHPAETSAAYDWIAKGQPNVTVLPPAAPLAPLLAAARAIVTVNSTVALDGAVLDIPALTIGLPNNLTPFADAGAIAGSADAAELPVLLRRILYDDEFRQQLAERRRVVLGRSAIRSDGRAAATAADAVRELAARGRRAAEQKRSI